MADGGFAPLTIILQQIQEKVNIIERFKLAEWAKCAGGIIFLNFLFLRCCQPPLKIIRSEHKYEMRNGEVVN
jgi:hypothetical protein